jgi:serine phosphatase RsbU (regulator of sigma subunit)/PAS domain-containing protein
MDELAARRDALRQATTAPGADPRALLDAALTELDAAIDALGDKASGPAGDPSASDGAPDAVRAERRLLHAAFQQTPAPLFLLSADGAIRRASSKAGELLGAPAGYATGKPLTVFVDLPQRATVQTQLAAVVRTGEPRQVACRMLTPDGPADVTLAVTAVDLPGDPPVLVAIVTSGTPDLTAGSEPEPEPGNGRRVAALVRRLDMVTAVTGLLLDNSTFSEAVTIQRVARLLAGELADWVIVDVAHGGGLRRQVVAGPRGPEGDQAVRAARDADPEPSTLPWQVHTAGKSVVLAHAADPALLGSGVDGTPLLMTLGATSLLAVPITDGTDGHGTLTLARSASSGHFTMADLGLAEDLARHLATSMRVDQMFRRRSEAAQALQASLLPERLPDIPGLEFAASYLGATRWQEISGDFYDVFRTPSGWAVAIGDVCGIGQEAAAMTAAARHAIRALAHMHQDPEDVLAAASEVLLSGDYGERFVTAMLAFPKTTNGGCRVRLGNAGHPGPAVLRADGRVEILSGEALPLGLLPDTRPGEVDLELGSGDLLFFYTDGVTQASSEDEEYFDDRLADALVAAAGRSAAETVRAVTEELTDFSHGEFRDDVTMLAMRIQLPFPGQASGRPALPGSRCRPRVVSPLVEPGGRYHARRGAVIARRDPRSLRSRRPRRRAGHHGPVAASASAAGPRGRARCPGCAPRTAAPGSPRPCRPGSGRCPPPCPCPGRRPARSGCAVPASAGPASRRRGAARPCRAGRSASGSTRRLAH